MGSGEQGARSKERGVGSGEPSLALTTIADFWFLAFLPLLGERVGVRAEVLLS